ncbi:MAG TPA: L,D-transpeptidase family protein, partial [Pseudomonadales bacterium]|nr:L,D-transpeptidase family protein [Pseudomonadales bacterium]
MLRNIGLALVLVCSAGCSYHPAPPPSAPGEPARAAENIPQHDRIIIEKSRHQLRYYANGQLVASYKVALGQNPVGAKTCSGDKRTPEGIYFVSEHIRDSGFYRALRISYPNLADLQRARKQGCDPGGDILIHGLQNGFGYVGRLHAEVDWTRGCIAI